jgi:hypothetical protein
MDRVTRCMHCGKRLVPTHSVDGRTALSCIWCDKVDPMETDVAKWADGPLAQPALAVVPRP